MPTINPKRRRVDIAALAALFHQVAEPIRAHVFVVLGDGERHVGALCAELGCSMTVLSRHLTVLRLIGLVEARRDGRRNAYALSDAGRAIREAVEALGGGQSARARLELSSARALIGSSTRARPSTRAAQTQRPNRRGAGDGGAIMFAQGPSYPGMIGHTYTDTFGDTWMWDHVSRWAVIKSKLGLGTHTRARMIARNPDPPKIDGLIGFGDGENFRWITVEEYMAIREKMCP